MDLISFRNPVRMVLRLRLDVLVQAQATIVRVEERGPLRHSIYRKVLVKALTP